MSLPKSNARIAGYYRISMEWNSVDKWADIPPSDDALKIRFLSFKETRHGFGTHEDVHEEVGIRQTEKVITIRPSELCNEDTTSIKQSNSVRMIEDFFNTEFTPSESERRWPIVVDRVIDFVQNEMESPLPPNRVIDVMLSDGMMIVHDIRDKKGVLDYMEATKRETCAICMDDFQVGYDASRLPCLHVFHGNCVVNWLYRNHTCPICRCPVPPERITWF